MESESIWSKHGYSHRGQPPALSTTRAHSMLRRMQCLAPNATILFLALFTGWASGFSHDLPNLMFSRARPFAHLPLARHARGQFGCIALKLSSMEPGISGFDSAQGNVPAPIDQDSDNPHFSVPLEGLPLEQSVDESLNVGRKSQTRRSSSLSKTRPYVRKSIEDKDLMSRRLLFKLGLAVGIREVPAKCISLRSYHIKILAWLSPTHCSLGRCILLTDAFCSPR
jgi:hypothetical protein